MLHCTLQKLERLCADKIDNFNKIDKNNEKRAIIIDYRSEYPFINVRYNTDPANLKFFCMH